MKISSKEIETARAKTIDNIPAFLQLLDDLLAENVNPSESQRISIYCSKLNISDDVDSGRIALKTTVQDILGSEIAHLNAYSHEVLSHLERLCDDRDKFLDFWEDRQGGLAMFIGHDSFRSAVLRDCCLPNWSFSRYWHLSPLLDVASNADAFWLLSLSQNSVKLYQGSRFGLRAVTVPGMPTSFSQSLIGELSVDGDDPNAEVISPDKQKLSKFFAEIDKSITRVITPENRYPMILASVDFYQPIYGKINRYENLHDDSICGNPEHMTHDDLQSSALEKLAPVFNESKFQQLDRINQLAGKNLSVFDLENIMPMAFQGRVKSLVIPSRETVWGNCDPAGEKIVLLKREDLESRDLYQLAAEETLLHGGRIYFISADNMPNRANACAELRY